MIFFVHFSTPASLEGKKIKFGKFKQISMRGGPWNLPQILNPWGGKSTEANFIDFIDIKPENAKKVSI